MQLNATIIGQSISFILFVIFCMKYIWPTIISAIEERQKKIFEGIKLSEKAKKDLDEAHKNGVIYIKKAKEEAKNIIEKANKNKYKIIEQAKIDAEIERKKIINQAYVEINIEKNQIYETIKNSIIDLVISVSEKVIEKNIDTETHKDFINKMISKF